MKNFLIAILFLTLPLLGVKLLIIFEFINANEGSLFLARGYLLFVGIFIIFFIISSGKAIKDEEKDYTNKKETISIKNKFQ